MAEYEDGYEYSTPDLSAPDRALNLVCSQAGDLNNMLEGVQKELHVVSQRKAELEEAQKIIVSALGATEDIRIAAAERDTKKAMAEG